MRSKTFILQLSPWSNIGFVTISKVKHQYQIVDSRQAFPLNCSIASTCNLSHKAQENLKFLNTGSKPFECKTCKKSIPRSDSLKEHERIHTGERPYKCKMCNKSFVYGSNFKKHEKSHIGGQP